MKPLKETLAYFGLLVGILIGVGLGGSIGVAINYNQFPPITKIFANFNFVENVVFHSVLFAVVFGGGLFLIGSNIEDKN